MSNKLRFRAKGLDYEELITFRDLESFEYEHIAGDWLEFDIESLNECERLADLILDMANNEIRRQFSNPPPTCWIEVQVNTDKPRKNDVVFSIEPEGGSK